MAQPKRPRKNSSPERQEIENLEKKSSGFIARRNELNDQARIARQERDLLHDEKQAILSKMQSERDKRNAWNDRLRGHKEKRNAFQARAKEILRARRPGPRAKGDKGRVPLAVHARQLRQQAREMEYAQETTAMTKKEEERVVKQIRLKREELAVLEPKLLEAQRLAANAASEFHEVDELFKRADEEHAQVVECYKAAQKHHEAYVALVKEAGSAIAQANAKHAEFVEIRIRADAQHHKAMEMRDRIFEIKGQRRESAKEARQIVKERSAEVRKKVADPKKLEEHALDALEELKRGGKITFG